MKESQIHPLVLVLCMTYNHEPYIEKALNGFAMQKTDFPFVVVVVDDASTDNNTQVITKWVSENCDGGEGYFAEDKDYGIVTHAYAKNNSNCLFYVILLKENHYLKKTKRPYYARYEDLAKYTALCEGDDYWTDPYKLQKQVDFLEAHAEYSVCWHRCRHFYVKENVFKMDVNCDRYLRENMDGVEVTLRMFFKSWITQPLSMMYRNHLIPEDVVLQYSSFRDTYQIYHLLKAGKGYLMNFIGGVYNITGEGEASKLDAIQACQFELQSADELYAVNRDGATKEYWRDTVLWSLHTYMEAGRKDLYWQLIWNEIKCFPIAMMPILFKRLKYRIKTWIRNI